MPSSPPPLKWNSPAPQVLEGSYCITTQGTWYSETIQAADFMKEYAKNFQTALVEHTNWWNTYWEKSQIHLPDPVLENQWYLEMYKFGSASRKNAPPICLQYRTNYKTNKKPVKMDYLDDIDISEFREIPTYKRMCVCILKNDHACKYMGFALNKEEAYKRDKIMEQFKNMML